MRLNVWRDGVCVVRRGDPHWLAMLHVGGFAWRRRGHWYHIKAPWNPPLFSERYGHVQTLWRALGWRLLKRAHVPATATPEENV